MTEPATAQTGTIDSATKPALPGLLSRIIGVIFSPRKTFEAVVATPRWFGVLAVIVVVSAVLLGSFLLSPTGQQAFLDNMERAGSTPEQLAAMQRFVPYIAYGTIAWIFIGTPIFLALISAILFGIFAMLGGEARFKQVFAVVTHGSVVSVVGAIVTVPMQFMTGSMNVATNASAFLPMIDDKSFLFFLAQKIDLFTIWLIVTVSIGLGVLYRRRTTSTATTLFILYALIALGIAAVQAARS